MAQMKEQNKTPEKELNEMWIANLSDAEFKALVTRMLKELTGYFNNIKKAQAEMKVTLSEIKKNLQGNNSENQINDLEHKEERNTIRTARRKKNSKKKPTKNKERIRSFWDISKHTNI